MQTCTINGRRNYDLVGNAAIFLALVIGFAGAVSLDENGVTVFGVVALAFGVVCAVAAIAAWVVSDASR